MRNKKSFKYISELYEEYSGINANKCKPLLSTFKKYSNPYKIFEKSKKL